MIAPPRTTALIAERSCDVERDVEVLGPRRRIPGFASMLVLVRVVGEREPMWIAKERLAGEVEADAAAEADPGVTSEAAPMVPGGIEV